VEFVRREGAVLIVSGLHAIHGSPVLDVKAYVPQFDAFPGAITPLHWERAISHADDLSRGARRFHWETTNGVLGARRTTPGNGVVFTCLAALPTGPTRPTQPQGLAMKPPLHAAYFKVAFCCKRFILAGFIHRGLH
jgi:hypothetical protein